MRASEEIVVTALVVAIVASAAIAPASEVVWLWSGAVTARSATVKARVTRPASEVRLLLAAEPSFADPRRIAPEPPAPHAASDVVAFALGDLEPDTLYHYTVIAEQRGDPKQGRFRTFAEGPMSFGIAFGSCATTGSSHRIFDTIRDRKPHLFLHLGDLHYENIGRNEVARFHRAFDDVLASSRQSALYLSTPIAYVWDDHDYGPNDADGSSPSRPAALAAYRSAVPHYPLTEQAGEIETIQQAFSIGRVRFLLSDVRARRDPVDQPDGPAKSMLGPAQLTWLLRHLELAAASDGLLVWVNPVPWITREDPKGEHGWAPYAHERRSIADRIAELGLADRMLMLSGDGHMVAIDDGTNSNYATGAGPDEPGFPVVHAAPLDRFPRSKGGPYSHGVAMHRRFFSLIKDQQFGWMEVRDDGDVLEVELSGHDSKGRLLKGTRAMRLRLRCQPACRVLPD